MRTLSKANRQKGQKREARQFVCWCHETPVKGPIRFSYTDAWRDWKSHNEFHHDRRPDLGWTGDWEHVRANGKKLVGGQEILSL